MRLRFGVSLAAGATWSSATQKPLHAYSWIHIENRAVVGSGNDVLVDTLAEALLGQGVDGYWRYLAAGQRITDNACGPDDAPAEGLTLTNIGTATVLLLVEIASTPIVHFSDFPTEATGGGGGGGTVTQGTAAAIAGGWPVEITDGTHGPAAVSAANALKVDGSAVTQPISAAAPLAVTESGAWTVGLVAGTAVCGAVQNATEQFADSTTVLAAGATFNGTARDSGNNAGAAGAGWSRFRVFAFSDQVGTINVQQARISGTWFTTLSQAVGASAATIIESIVTLRFLRVQYVNGATLQTQFELDSAFVSV